MTKHTAIKISAAITALILCCTIIGIPIAVIILQLGAIMEQTENKQ